MSEYLAVALIIFIPVAVVGYSWLRKRGLSPRAIRLLLIVALVLVGLFPVMASSLNPFALAGLHVVVFVGAGLLVWAWGKPQPVISERAGQNSCFASQKVTGEELSSVTEEAEIGSQSVRKVEIDEHLTVTEAEPGEESLSASVVSDTAAGIEYVTEEVGTSACEVELVSKDEVDASGEAEESAPDGEAELLGFEGPGLGQDLQAPVEGPEREVAGEAELIGDDAAYSIEMTAPVGAEAENETPQTVSPVAETSLAETGADIESLIDKGFSAKSKGDYGEAASSFFAAWQVSTEPELHFLLGMELVTLYRETGDYSKALEILDVLAQSTAIGKARAEMAAREKGLLEITKRLLREIGMPDLPASQIPRFIRHKAWEEFISVYHNK